ncbi:hypothetical protein [Escherichia coli]|uniref:hypothetical protein n=1 Tax=Escherichia coli TaxID=562 RepID=UPI0013DDFB7D|nr:hypothetical protein [Escherichia coli]QIF16416.1 hypothetical protein G6Z99_26340 [Escherichia coli]
MMIFIAWQDGVGRRFFAKLWGIPKKTKFKRLKPGDGFIVDLKLINCIVMACESFAQLSSKYRTKNIRFS